MFLSIITVCFNSETTISKTIESVLNQNFFDFEYIIVDGKSNDKTLEVVGRYKDSFKSRGINFKIISEKDNGIYDAMNKGIMNSSGDVIGIINSDDWYEPDTFSKVFNEFKNSDIEYLYSNLRIIKRNNKSFVKKAKKMRFVTTAHWNHPSSFVKRSVYDKIGLFKNYGLSDDFDFYLRCRKNKINIKPVTNQIFANFTLGGASNKKKASDLKYRIKDRYRCYKDNGFSKFYYLVCLGMELIKFTLI